MRVHKRAIITTIVGTSVSFLAMLLYMAGTNSNVMFLSTILGVFSGCVMSLLIAASVYRTKKHALLSEIMILVSQTKSICNKIRSAEKYAYVDKVDLLLQSYHKIKNFYTLLIQLVLDFDPITKNLPNRIITFSEEIYELEIRLKRQLQLNHAQMENTFANLILSLPIASIEEMEDRIAKKIINAKQLKLYRSVEQACGNLLDMDQIVSGSR